MFSLSPGTPARSAQIPRTVTSTCTPAIDARYSASITPSSTIEFIFSRTRPPRPAVECSISRSIRATMPLRMECGATSRFRYSVCRE